MKTLTEHIDDLDRMVDSGSAPKHEIRSQIAFIGREVTALQADNLRLADAHAKLQAMLSEEMAALKAAHQQELPQPHATVVERGMSERERQLRHL